MSEIEIVDISWDDRKTVLDVWYDAGGTVPPEVDLRDFYPALLAVAAWGAEQQRDILRGVEFGSMNL